jgi:hypothetical protein
MWPYKVIDNFLPKKDFMILTDNILKIKAKNKIEREFFNYDPTPQIADLLKEFPKHRKCASLKKFIHYAITPTNFVHKIHDEAPFKIMSAIIYLHPENNYGTTLYHSEKTVEVEWKPNRLMVFCGETGVTWHDYKSSTMRYTYNYFLVDPAQIKNEEYKAHAIA